jgi:hypothetical protein
MQNMVRAEDQPYLIDGAVDCDRGEQQRYKRLWLGFSLGKVSG